MNEPVRGGEPEIAINPGNPNNLVLGHTVVGNSYANTSSAAGMEAVNGGLQVSNDGGKTWTADRALHTSGYSEGPDPYLIAHGQPGATGFTLTTNGVGDPIEASGPDGSIYAGGVLAHTTPTGPPPFGFSVPQGGIAVARSTDGGRTFGRISVVLSDQDVQGMVSRGMNPKGIGTFGVIPFDRPWMAVDQSTGAVYVSTTGHPQRYVAVSHDHGRTWGRIEALDCDEVTPPNANRDVSCATYPQSGDGTVAAVHGVLAAAYISRAAPGSSCPCVVFETSTDAGAHWSRHIVPTGLPGGEGVFVAADSSHTGHYAVLIPSSVPQEVQVVTTGDSGHTWSTPIGAGQRACPAHHQPSLDRIRADWRLGRPVAQRLPAVQPEVLLDAGHPECVRSCLEQQRKDVQRSGSAELRAITAARPQSNGRRRRVLGRRDDTVRIRRVG